MTQGQLEVEALPVHPSGHAPAASPGVEPRAECAARQRCGERMRASRLAGCSGVGCSDLFRAAMLIFAAH